PFRAGWKLRRVRVRYAQLPTPTEGQLAVHPFLSVWLVGPKGRFKMQMLVDSGSAETLVPSSIVRRLGVPISNESIDLIGLGGTMVEAKIAKLDVEFGFGKFRL